MPVTIQSAVTPQPNPAALAGTKRMFIKSYGCQMNVYDGLRMADLMAPLGYQLQESYEDADLIILNTCHIREKADDKMFSDIGRFQRAAADNAIIAVGGCTGQALGAKIMQQMPTVAVVFGPQTLHRLPHLIEKVEQGRLERKNGNKNAPIRATDTDFPELEKFDALPQAKSYGPSTFLTIQEGCDKFCTYCVVPYTRGAEISRPVNSILEEARKLVDQGTKEITLLGQNVNAYHGEDSLGNEIDLPKLLAELANIQGLDRLRFTTSHPMNTTEDLLQAFAKKGEMANEKLMPYFHLPVQAGSNKILTAMNRSHTAEDYLAKIQRAKELRPDIAISGDLIVGFPGETEADFEQTLAMVAAVEYATCYSFAYSPRPGTPGADMPNQVEELVKKERLAQLQALLDTYQTKFNSQFLGQTTPVLVEEFDKTGQRLRGRNPQNVSVNINLPAQKNAPAQPGRDLIGEIVNVMITDARPKSLVGTTS